MIGVYILLLLCAFCVFMAIKTTIGLSSRGVSREVSQKQDYRALFLQVYHLAPETSFPTLYNRIASRLLNTTTYTVNQSILTEKDAIQKVRSEREMERIGIRDLEGKTPDEMAVIIENDINDLKRPDKVQKRIVMYVEDYFHCPQYLAEDICFPLIKEVHSFKLKYDREIGFKDVADENAWEGAMKAYEQRKSDGLGFGIITNSVSNMAAYSILDAHERRKQLREQENSISRQHGIQAGANAMYFCNEILNYYENEYKSKAIAAVKLIAEVMKNDEMIDKMMPYITEYYENGENN